jgi:hypothetical protein
MTVRSLLDRITAWSPVFLLGGLAAEGSWRLAFILPAIVLAVQSLSMGSTQRGRAATVTPWY